jgi:hypothetical protein
MSAKKGAKKTYLARHQILFHSAAIGAHARFGTQGFRQKDLRFLIELFSNWLQSTLDGPTLSVENTQIARYLDRMVREGLAKQVGREKPPRYQLTRVGLMEHLSHLVHRPHWWPIEEFFFVYYFLESYRHRIESLIVNAGTLYTDAMKLEIRQWLDLRRYVERQERLLDQEIAKLDLRIGDCSKTAGIVRRGKVNGRAPAEILEEIYEQVPYQLNHQKPMRELFRETPDEDWIWEMEVGSEKRAGRIFGPLKQLLVHLRCQVTELNRAATRP